MFRKITSNRDPAKTLGSELKKEFVSYFESAGQQSRRLMAKYPRQIFTMMVIAMIFSGILAFTVMRSTQAPEFKPMPAYRQQAMPELSQIISTAGALQTLWGLQRQIDSLLQKDGLSRADSLHVKVAVAQMDSLRNLIRKSRHDQKQSKTITP